MPVKARLAGLRQKTLFRIAVAYAVSAWLVIQVAATVAPAFEMSAWFLRGVILIALLGFVATVGYFAFVRPEQDQAESGTQRRFRFVSLLGGGALIVAAIVGAGFVARTTMFGQQEVALAVLPFADLSPGRDKAYFAEGVAEEILSTLSAEQGIRVLGRSSARQLDRNPDPADVRRTLGVTHLLEGSARTSGDELRVNVRLIDTENGSQVWEEEYDGRLADIFAVQDKIAGAVVKRLRGSLIGGGSGRAAERPSFDSYATYLAARALMRNRSKAQLEEALALARTLVASDPGYAPGQALLAELFYMLSDDGTAYGDMPVDEARRLAIPHAREAIRLAPGKAEGYAALGLIVSRDQAVVPLQRAIRLDPARTEVRIWLGIALTALGRHDEAFEQYREAALVEPLWSVSINRVTQTLAASGRADEAKAVVQLYRRRGGAEAQALRFEAFIARSRVDLSHALAIDRAAIARDPNVQYVADWLFRQYHLLGLRDQALAIKDGRLGGRYRELWLGGDRQTLRRLVRSAPGAAATAPDAAQAFFAMGALRDWPTLARLVALRPASAGDLCLLHGVLMPQIILALRETGAVGESRRLTECARRLVDQELQMSVRSPEDDPGRLEMRKASVLALSGDRAAIDWLDRAVERGWIGQYFSSQLADWPQFDSLRSDPQLAALQRRIDATIARERAETLRDLETAP